MRLFLVAVPIVICLTSAPPAAAQDAESRVLEPIHRLFDAMRAGDTVAVRASFQPGATVLIVDAGGENSMSQRTLDDFVALIGARGGTPLDERPRSQQVRIDGPLAHVWMPYDFHVGERFSHCGTNSFQMVRGDGGWLIGQLAYTRQRMGCQ
jgi:hypothetical protein